MPEREQQDARAVHGYSAGADVAVLTGGAVRPELETTLLAAVPEARLSPVGSMGALASLADRASDRPLIVVDGTVELSEPGLPALVDLLDRPGDDTATLLIDPADPEAPPVGLIGLERATVARVGADGRLVESVGGSQRRVGKPNRVVVGVLRIRGSDRPAAADAWRRVAAGPDFDLALTALVRTGIEVGARPYGYYRWTRAGSHQDGAPGSGWRQRLRTASRGGDGLYSAAVVRRLSRRGTALALRAGWTPNGVTAASLLIGLFAAALVYTGAWWAWVLAAVLLQLALVVDCMDGEIARFTRRFSSLGGWLDGVGDRVKEYALFAALAAVAVRDGQPSGWLWAIVAMVLVTGRHLEDHSYTDKLAPGRASRPDLGPLDRPDDASADSGAPTIVPGRPNVRARVVFWAKKVAHLPIAERYLLLSLLLLTRQPLWTLGVAVVANALALLWALGGRTLRELRRPEPAATVDSGNGPLDVQLDLGLPVRLLQRVWRRRGPFLPGVVGLLAAWLGVIACVCTGLTLPALAGAVLAVVILAATTQLPVRHRFGWLLPPLLWAGEAAVAAALLAHDRPGSWLGGAIFAFLAVTAYRRYDLIYGLRLRPSGPSRLDPLVGFGVEGRVIWVCLVLLVSLALPVQPARAIVVGLVIGAVLVGFPAAVASVREWRSAGR